MRQCGIVAFGILKEIDARHEAIPFMKGYTVFTRADHRTARILLRKAGSPAGFGAAHCACGRIHATHEARQGQPDFVTFRCEHCGRTEKSICEE